MIDDIIHYFQNWESKDANEIFIEHWKDLMAGANILFYYDGQSVMQDIFDLLRLQPGCTANSAGAQYKL